MESTLLETLNATPLFIMRLLFGAIIAVLFIQSGLDKVFNYKGEQAFYKKHFEDTVLYGMVPFLMPVITLFELGAGFATGAGLIIYWVFGHPDVAIVGLLLACLAIIQLFLGQRVAKDYEGAAVLVPYFLLTAAGLYVYLIG